MLEEWPCIHNAGNVIVSVQGTLSLTVLQLKRIADRHKFVKVSLLLKGQILAHLFFHSSGADQRKLLLQSAWSVAPSVGSRAALCAPHMMSLNLVDNKIPSRKGVDLRKSCKRVCTYIYVKVAAKEASVFSAYFLFFLAASCRLPFGDGPSQFPHSSFIHHL